MKLTMNYDRLAVSVKSTVYIITYTHWDNKSLDRAVEDKDQRPEVRGKTLD